MVSVECCAVLTDAVKRMQRVAKRQLLAFVALLFILSAILVWIVRLVETGADLHSILFWLVMIIVVASVYVGTALALYINRISQCVMGAIVLLAKDLQR